MSELTNVELEGRLNAQREILAVVLARLTKGIDDPLWTALDETFELQNHEEDPGAVPQTAFAVEAETEREFRLIVERAKSRAREARNP